MLKIWIGNSTSPRQYTVDPNATVRQVLAQAGQSVKSNSVVQFDSGRLSDRELDMTLAQLGVTDDSSITVTTKMMSA